MPFPSFTTSIVIIVGLVALGIVVFYDSGVGLLIVGLYALAIFIRKSCPGNCPSCRRSRLMRTSWENGGAPGSLLGLLRGWNHFKCKSCGRQWKTRVIGMHPADNRAFSVQPLD